MKKLLFITTSSLASNPRLVKEFECLKHSYSCYVICFKHFDWSLSLSEEIKARNKEVHFIEIDRKQSLKSTIVSKLLHKVSIKMNPIFKDSFKVCAYASNDKTPQLVSYVNRICKTYRFERLIAHNLGAFYPAVKKVKEQNSSLQLDIEDFYPGEALYFNKSYESANRHCIMQHSFNAANTITYASKGIEIECLKTYSTQSITEHLTIINAFESVDFKLPKASDNVAVKCVWFSQNIGPNRGLEQVFETAILNPKVEFHLIGNRNTAYLETIKPSDNIFFHDIMPQNQLHEFIGKMDIGLALESKDADSNRNICLTNKFLAYAQAGLYVLATDTFGQRDFLKQLTYNAGEIISDNLSASLSNLNAQLLDHKHKVERWENAKLFSWEKEQSKLLKLIK